MHAIDTIDTGFVLEENLTRINKPFGETVSCAKSGTSWKTTENASIGWCAAK
jgi:hypothetical protein